MSTPLLIGCLWVVAATVVAFLPMRRQYAPGFALLLAAPVLLIWLGVEHGLWVGLAATAAFLSMFRNPLIYLTRRAFGKPVQRPDADPPAPGDDAP